MNYEKDFPAFLRGHEITRFVARELCPVGRLALGRGPALKAPPCELWANIIPTVKIAQEAREHFGRPMLVASGYRDPAYNRAVGGSSGSLHMVFRAMDVRMPGITPRALYDWFDRRLDAHTLGLGLYPTFVHIDTRGFRARF